MIMKQYSSMSKASLVRKIMKALKKLPKAKLAKLCYELEKSMLPTISTTKKGMPRLTARRAFTKTRTKKLTQAKRKQMLARINRGQEIRYVERRMPRSDTGFPRKPVPRPMRKAKPRSPAQRANDKRLGMLAKERAKARRKGIRISYNMRA